MENMNWKNNKDFLVFKASRTRLTFEQAVQNANLKDALAIFDDISISYVFRYHKDFFIIEAPNEQGDTRWIVPGEIMQSYCESIERAEEVLFEEFHEYIVEPDVEDAPVPVFKAEITGQEDVQLGTKANWMVNYKWVFIVAFKNNRDIEMANYPLTSFGPDYAAAKNFLVIRMKNKNQQLLRIFSAKALAVHFAYYPDFTEVPPEKYVNISLPGPPSQW